MVRADDMTELLGGPHQVLRAMARVAAAPLRVWLLSILLEWLAALQGALFTMLESVEQRVRKVGFPPGAAPATRDELHAEERAAAPARYAARCRS